MTVTAFGAGAAAIAFWAVVRYPRLGPQTVTRALLAVGAVFVLQTPLLGLVGPVAASQGIAAALLLVVLPSLTLLFWAAGCLVRSLVTLAAPYRR